jgi:hypothetical protein
MLYKMYRIAMEHRFPHFIDLFFYNKDGSIYGFNRDFTWHDYDFFTIKNYVTELMQNSERENIEKIMNMHIQTPK